MRRRRHQLWFFLPCYALSLIVVSWVGLVVLLADDWSAVYSDGIAVFLEWRFWAGAMIPVSVLLGLQALILLPALRFQLSKVEKGKPLLLSILVLSVFAAAITLGLVLGLWELGLMLTDDSSDIADHWAFGWVWWGVLGASWLFWTAAFYRYTRRSRRPENRVGRVIGMLIGGSIVEIALLLPVDIMVRRRTDCYCATGTFFALGFSMLACFWLAGPGAFIAVTGKRRRAWYETHCETCGHERGPTPGDRCPECGEIWPHVSPAGVTSTPEPASSNAEYTSGKGG